MLHFVNRLRARFLSRAKSLKHQAWAAWMDGTSPSMTVLGAGWEATIYRPRCMMTTSSQRFFL
jgi:hypothetical protein